MIGLQIVSLPVARSPAGRPLPAAHATHAWLDTYSFTKHAVAVQLAPVAPSSHAQEPFDWAAP